MTPEEMSRLTAVEERSKSNTHRINELSGQIEAVNELATSVKLLVKENEHQTEAIKGVKEDVATLSNKVETIEQKPAKKWESFGEKVLWLLAAAIIGFALAHVGLA
ncbi:MAG: hypothetical protein IJV64_06465 [Oscillospiraceae bacterium]|nr:hypothetical protein [Oscillospiraceae bacterium]